MLILKNLFFQKNFHIMGVVNFNGDTKYEKCNKFNLEQLYFIKNDNK